MIFYRIKKTQFTLSALFLRLIIVILSPIPHSYPQFLWKIPQGKINFCKKIRNDGVTIAYIKEENCFY